MFWTINKFSFSNSIISPEDKNNSFSLFWDCTNGCIRKIFPSFSRMACSKSRADCKNSIQEKNPLFCPVRKICFCSNDWEVWLKLFKYISETWLRFWTIWYRKRKSHGSSWSMIRILPKDYDFYWIKWGHIKCTKNIFQAGKHGVVLYSDFTNSVSSHQYGFQIRLSMPLSKMDEFWLS